MASSLRLFVSMSAQDGAFMETLLAHAAKADLDAWHATTLDDVDTLLATSRAEMVNRPAAVVLLSPASFASARVRAEHALLAALRRRHLERIVLPVSVAAFDPALWHDWPLRFIPAEEMALATDAPSAEVAAARLRAMLHPSVDPVMSDAVPVADALVWVRALLFRNHYADAERLVAQCVARQPESFLPRYLLGTLQHLAGKYDEAVHTLALALQAEPESVAALVKRAQALYPYRKFDETFAALDQVERLDPENAFQWQVRGRAHTRVLQWAQAQAAFERAVTLEPASASIWLDQAKALHHLRRYDEALMAADHSLRLWESLHGWDQRAATLIQLERFDEALAAYAHALALRPVDGDLREKQALLLAYLGRAKDAIAAWEMLLDDATDASLWGKPRFAYFRGLCLLELGRTADALAAFDVSLTSRVYEDEQDHAHVRLLDEPTVLANGDGEVLRVKALALLRLGRPADALVIYAALLARIPIDVDLWQRKGWAHWLAGQGDAARDALVYAQVLSLDARIARHLQAMKPVEATTDDLALHAEIRAAAMTAYDHSRTLGRQIAQRLHIPHQPKLTQLWADEAVETIERSGYGVASIKIDKIVQFDDIPAFLELARRLSTVPGPRLTAEQYTPYETSCDPITLALFIYYKVLAFSDDISARAPLELLCQRYDIPVTKYLPRRYQSQAVESDDPEADTEEEAIDEELEERILAIEKQAEVLQEAQDFAGAAALLEEALRLDSTHILVALELGDLYQTLGRDEDALALYQLLREMKDDYSAVPMQQATIWQRQGRLDEALTAIEWACQLAEQEGSYGNPRGRYGITRAKILVELGRAAEAVAVLSPLIAAAPEDVYLLLERGRSLTQMGKWPAAVADFTQATRLHAEMVYAWHSLAYALYRCNRWSEALAAIDHALLLSTDAPIIGTKGEILLGMNEYEAALQWLDQALAKNPNDGEHWRDKAAALRHLGRLAEAEASEARARQLPDLHPPDAPDEP